MKSNREPFQKPVFFYTKQQYPPKKKYFSKITIKGKAKGKISNARKVVIAETGIYIGDIEASVLEIFGKVKGSVNVDNLIIHGDGRLIYSKISYKKVHISKGAFYCAYNQGDSEQDGEKTDVRDEPESESFAGFKGLNDTLISAEPELVKSEENSKNNEHVNTEDKKSLETVIVKDDYTSKKAKPHIIKFTNSI